MKILAVCGSPRKGNTEFMLNTIFDEIHNHRKDLVLLRKLKIEHCTGCDICYNQGKPCYIKDDMVSLYKRMLDSDVIIFGSPNYFKNVSSLMKTFIDRTNALVHPTKLKGKKAAIICVGGQSLKNTEHCENNMKEFVKDHKMELIDSIKAKADAPREIKKSKRVISQLKKLGNKIDKLK